MYVNHVGRDITLGFDTKEEAEALFAVMSGNANMLDPKAAAYGQWLYGWLYEHVQKLATNFQAETQGFRESPRPPQNKRDRVSP